MAVQDAVETAASRAVDTILTSGGVPAAVSILAVAIGFAVAGLFWWEARSSRRDAQARLDACAKAHSDLQEKRLEDGRALLVALERSTLVLQQNDESRRGVMENLGELLQGFAKLVASHESTREQNRELIARMERQHGEFLATMRSIDGRLGTIENRRGGPRA